MAIHSVRYDSGPSLTIGGFGRDIKIHMVSVLYVSSAAGRDDRQVELGLFNENDETVLSIPTGRIQTQNDIKNYIWMPGVYRETSPVHDSFLVPAPPEIIVRYNWTMRIWDDFEESSSDTMTTDIQYSDYYATI